MQGLMDYELNAGWLQFNISTQFWNLFTLEVISDGNTVHCSWMEPHLSMTRPGLESRLNVTSSGIYTKNDTFPVSKLETKRYKRRNGIYT